jgi:hypothetical protein
LPDTMILLSWRNSLSGVASQGRMGREAGSENHT